MNGKRKRTSVKQIFVRTLNGQTILLQIPSQQVDLSELKRQIERRTQIPVVHQRLIYGGRPVTDSTPIDSGATVQLVLRLKGGFIADMLTPLIMAIVATIIIVVATTWRTFLSGIFCALTKGQNMFKCLVFYFLFCVFNIAHYLFVKIPLFIIDSIFGTDFMGMWEMLEEFVLELIDAFGEFAPNVKNALDDKVFSCFRC